MKKIVLLFVTATTMFACAPTEVKTDTAASATGTVTATGPDVDLIKKSITAWADGVRDGRKFNRNQWQTSIKWNFPPC